MNNFANIGFLLPVESSSTSSVVLRFESVYVGNTPTLQLGSGSGLSPLDFGDTPATASITGSDVAGRVRIKAGPGNGSGDDGTLFTVFFDKPYANVPHVFIDYDPQTPYRLQDFNSDVSTSVFSTTESFTLKTQPDYSGFKAATIIWNYYIMSWFNHTGSNVAINSGINPH